MKNRKTKIIIMYFTLLIPLGAESVRKSNPYYSSSWALIIGINDYLKVNKLNYAVNDANAIKSLLITSFDFPEENIFLIIDEDATLQGIKKAMKELAEKTSENDRVLLYFAGHGKTDVLASGGERGYLIPVDGDAEDLYLTSLPMDEIKNFSDKMGI